MRTLDQDVVHVHTLWGAHGYADLGGLFHTLPYLASDFRFATTIAIVVVMAELGIIAWIRRHYMDTPLLAVPSDPVA